VDVQSDDPIIEDAKDDDDDDVDEDEEDDALEEAQGEGILILSPLMFFVFMSAIYVLSCLQIPGGSFLLNTENSEHLVALVLWVKMVLL
jgi:hypothetical protein